MSLHKVTLLLDRSSSMGGTPVGQVTAFVNWSLLATLRENRHLYGHVLISLIAFDTSAEWLAKDVDVDSFVLPDPSELAVFGGASLGAAARLLEEEITRSGDSESDLIILLSDGHFVDDVVEATERFAHVSKSLRISLGVDASFRVPLAFFENWTKGGRKPAPDLYSVTPQDVEGWLGVI
jgi:uncharacterized protein YegL